MLEKKFKHASILPALFSFLSPSLSLSLADKRRTTLYLIPPLVADVYFFLVGNYNDVVLLSLSLLFLLAVYYLPIKSIAKVVYRIYPSLISLTLLSLAVYFYFFNLTYFALLTLTAIAIVFPYKVKIKGLAFALLSLINPFAGVSVSLFDYPAFFLLVPLVGYLFFHYSLLSFIFVLVGSLLYFVKDVNLRFNHVLLAVSVIYFSYSLYVFTSGYIVKSTWYLLFSLIFSLLSILIKAKTQLSAKELIAFLLTSFPFPFLSPIFVYLKDKVDVFPLLLISGLISTFLTATVISNIGLFIVHFKLLQEVLKPLFS